MLHLLGRGPFSEFRLRPRPEPGNGIAMPVPDQGEQSRRRAGDSQNIGKSDVPAACLTGIDAAQGFAGEDTDRNRAQKISEEHSQGERAEHQECPPSPRGSKRVTNCRMYWA